MLRARTRPRTRAAARRDVSSESPRTPHPFADAARAGARSWGRATGRTVEGGAPPQHPDPELQGGEAPDSVRMACYVGLTGDNEQCVSGLTAAGVTNGTAVSACRVAPE